MVASGLIGTAADAQGTGAADVARTPAGTVIVNVAHADFRDGETARTARSNEATLLVAERLDVTLAPGRELPAGSPAAAPVVLTNAGNGEEAFMLSASGATDAAVRGIAIDRDGDGRFDPAIDTLLGDTTPPVPPGDMLALLVLPMSTGTGAGTVVLTARATTGTGAIGATFVGGSGGGDAVVGPTGGVARIELLFPSPSAAVPTLVKTQAVRAPDGSAAAVTGAVVTYTLVATFPSGGTRAARIDDPVPAGTAYLPGTLTLDGRALTDAADDDPGTAGGDAVTVALGGVQAPGAVHEISFQVRLP